MGLAIPLATVIIATKVPRGILSAGFRVALPQLQLLQQQRHRWSPLWPAARHLQCPERACSGSDFWCSWRLVPGSVAGGEGAVIDCAIMPKIITLFIVDLLPAAGSACLSPARLPICSGLNLRFQHEPATGRGVIFLQSYY